MNINKILNGVEVLEKKGITNQNIESISFDNNIQNDLFICLKSDFESCKEDCLEAVKNGAKIIISQFDMDLGKPYVKTNDIRSAMSIIACNYYNHPSKSMKIIGITGTNGKTTSTYILKSILENAGYKVGLIGTNCNLIGDKVLKSNLTTPDPLELQYLFSLMKDSGCEYAIMEVSAHALYFHKLDGINFECSIFTNLTQDHLDFFKDMQSYSQAKSQLFTKNFTKNAIFNVDDEFGHIFARYCNCERVISYALDNPSDVFAVNTRTSLMGSNFFVNVMDDIAEIHFNIGGRHNIYNVLGCIACCHLLGIDLQTIVKGVEDVNEVDGRYNTFESAKGYTVVVDYAHTPDGLDNILKSLKGLTEKRLISVFGCGGNRDKTKRAIMGEISGDLADITILTSDNPRFEEPDEIIDQIEVGVKKLTNNYIKIENRKNAIEYAMKIAKRGDVILIAGKGQENYQDIKGVKYHFSDKEIVQEILNEEKIKENLQLHN